MTLHGLRAEVRVTIGALVRPPFHALNEVALGRWDPQSQLLQRLVDGVSRPVLQRIPVRVEVGGVVLALASPVLAGEAKTVAHGFKHIFRESAVKYRDVGAVIVVCALCHNALSVKFECQQKGPATIMKHT